MTGVSGVKSRSLWEVMDTITITNHADIEFIVIVNEKFWQGLSDEQRSLITVAADTADLAVRDAVTQIEADAYAAAKEQGMTVYTPNAEEIEQWKAGSASVLENYKADAGALGAKLLEAAQKL